MPRARPSELHLLGQELMYRGPGQSGVLAKAPHDLPKVSGLGGPQDQVCALGGVS